MELIMTALSAVQPTAQMRYYVVDDDPNPQISSRTVVETHTVDLVARQSAWEVRIPERMIGIPLTNYRELMDVQALLTST
jgi:hypothetical protein